jgi:uncharacterized membrane protein
VPDSLPNPGSNARRSRAGAIIASGLLLADLSLIVLYTSRPAFLSPLALVVVAAIGIAALLLQVRLRPDAALQNGRASSRGSLWLTALGVVFAIGAVIGDVLHLQSGFMLVTSLITIICFAASGIMLFNLLRKQRIRTPQTPASAAADFPNA